MAAYDSSTTYETTTFLLLDLRLSLWWKYRDDFLKRRVPTTAWSVVLQLDLRMIQTNMGNMH